MIGASVLEPGVYFAMNSPAAVIGPDLAAAAAKISSWGFALTPDMMTQLAQDMGEKTLLSRVGGAPTLAVGMAYILSGVSGAFGAAMMGVWYHFAILFEALFILTTVDAGTRVARFMIQDTVGSAAPKAPEIGMLLAGALAVAVFKALDGSLLLSGVLAVILAVLYILVAARLLPRDWFSNVIGSALAVAAWGYFLYQGVIDPLGGIRTLWPLFGISNQMLAGIALIACTVILFKMKRERYAWVTLIPTTWLLVCTLTAGLQKIFSPVPAIGFLAQAHKFEDALGAGKVLAPAKDLGEMSRVIFNAYLNATLAAIFVLVVVTIAVYESDLHPPRFGQPCRYRA